MHVPHAVWSWRLKRHVIMQDMTNAAIPALMKMQIALFPAAAAR